MSKHAKAPPLISQVDKNGNPIQRYFSTPTKEGVKPGTHRGHKGRCINYVSFEELCKKHRLKEEEKGIDTSSAHDRLAVLMKFDTKRKARVGLPIYYRCKDSVYWHPGRLTMEDNKFYIGVTEQEKKRANADGTMFVRYESGGIVEWKFQ